LSVGWSSAFAEPAHIVILRHGEKISDQNRHLAPRGRERAKALAEFFVSAPFLSVYGTPVALFAGSPADGASLRSVETMKPTAATLGLQLNSSFDKDDGAYLMESILQDPELDGKTVIVCWNRGGMTDLMSVLDGGPFPKKWEHEVFDRFWILDLLPSGKYSFKDLPQNLLPGDSTN
jgi:hypothetical protein